LIVAVVLGLLGALVAIPNAVFAITEVGHLPGYGTRVGFGWAALGFGILGAASGVLALARPRLASLGMFIAAVGGGVAISLFYINTFYLVAVPLWLLGALIALLLSFVSCSD